MSQRVYTETEFRDADVLREAAKSIDLPLKENGDKIEFGGKLAGSNVNGVQYGSGVDIKTGQLHYDDMFFKPEMFNPLKQAYTEKKHAVECMRQGVQIESREVDANGNIVLLCSLA